MPKALTVLAVEKAKATTVRREVPDVLAGLYLVVQPSGAKSWAVRYRAAGKPRKYTIGSYPAIDLASARDLARKTLVAVAEGRDPAQEKMARKTPAERDTVEKVAAEFIQRHVRANTRPSTAREVVRLLEKEIVPAWKGRLITEIGRRDIIELMDRLRDRGVGVMANRVFSVVRKLFNWAVSRDIVAVSPCTALRPLVPEISRDRLLDDGEIKLFWQAADRLGYPFGRLFQLLLLTGGRLSEVSDMTASELRLDERLWIIPKERAKNGVIHEVPLSDAALEIIQALPRIAGSHGYLFTTTGETPVSGFSRAKANLDKAMADLAAGEEPIPEWRTHDLRRTVASGMAKLGVALPVIEKCLAHVSGSFAGIVGVYQLHDFRAEKRRALDAWGRHVESIVRGEAAANVVPLRA
jgi:integrase